MLGYVWHTHASRSPSSPSVTLSWPHNVTIRGTEVERGRCLFVRNTVARNRERNERTLKDSVKFSMTTANPAMKPNLFGSLQMTNDSSLSGSYVRARTLPLLVQIKHAHTTRNTRARTHKRERERKRKRSLSRSRDKEIVAVRTKHTSSRSQGLLATNRRGGKLHCRQRQLLTKEVTWLAHSLNAQPFQQSLHPLCKYNCKMVQKYIIFILLFILLSLNLINLFPLYSFILLY